MASFNGRLAKSLNRLVQRRGTALRERYHARQLKTPREAFVALRYVLTNAHHHGLLRAGIDPMSSGPSFDGWLDAPPERLPTDAASADPTTWLLRVGWRRYGPLPVPRCQQRTT